MATLTSNDLLIRQQLILQKIAELGNVYANDLRWGKKCELKDRNRLLMLEIYSEIINEYNVSNVNSVGTIAVEYTLPPGNDIYYQVFVNGIAICENITYHTSFPEIPAIDTSIVNGINSYQSKYVATPKYDGKGYYVIVEGDCNEEEMTMVTSGCSFFVEGLSGGVCQKNNCIDNDDMLKMFDTISSEYNIIFPPLGATI